MGGESTPIIRKLVEPLEAELKNRPHGSPDDFGVEEIRCGLDQAQIFDPEGEHGTGDGAQVAHPLGLNQNDVVRALIQVGLVFIKDTDRVGVSPPGKLFDQVVVFNGFDAMFPAQLLDEVQSLVPISFGMEQHPFYGGGLVLEEFDGREDPQSVRIRECFLVAFQANVHGSSKSLPGCC